VDVRQTDDAATHSRGHGQISHLLLGPGDFGSRNLAVTWVECAPGSQQDLHAHPAEEQVYVIVEGRGTMTVGEEAQEVERGTLVFIPPQTNHAIRAAGDEPLIYVSAPAPPFEAKVAEGRWVPVDQRSPE